MTTTRLIFNPDELQTALRELDVRRAAVAYIGEAWRELLGDAGSLLEVVLSPTPGSNAAAIEEIATQIGWENVHFLERLHTKMYIGPDRVVLGSANLSSNGFGLEPSGLYEGLMESTEKSLRLSAEAEFEKLAVLAKSEYPSTDQKKARVAAMKAWSSKYARQQRAAQSELDAGAKPLSLGEYTIGSHRIFVEWWNLEGGDGRADIEEIVEVKLGCGNDRISVGDWILAWRPTGKGVASRRSGLTWVRVDEIHLGVNDDDDCPDDVVQRRKVRKQLTPFDIHDPAVIRAFDSAIADFKDLRPGGSGLASIDRCRDFLGALQNEFAPAVLV